MTHIKNLLLFFACIIIIFVVLNVLVPRIIEIGVVEIEQQKEVKNTFYTITGYSHLDSCHNPTSEGCLMANGKLATVGYVACPRTIPLGTRVKIMGKVYECGDRLSSRFKNRFDIWFGYGREAYQRAIEFGKQKAEVVIL